MQREKPIVAGSSNLMIDKDLNLIEKKNSPLRIATDSATSANPQNDILSVGKKTMLRITGHKKPRSSEKAHEIKKVEQDKNVEIIFNVREDAVEKELLCKTPSFGVLPNTP